MMFAKTVASQRSCIGIDLSLHLRLPPYMHVFLLFFASLPSLPVSLTSPPFVCCNVWFAEYRRWIVSL